MTDPERDPALPEPGPDAEPRFEEPSDPAPAVVDPPARSTEF